MSESSYMITLKTCGICGIHTNENNERMGVKLQDSNVWQCYHVSCIEPVLADDKKMQDR